MKRIFEKVGMNKPKRSAFDLSHEVKTSCDWADLNPIMCQEVVPGDQFSVNSEVLVRMAPTIAPVMHRVDVYVHHFFVPNRIIWSGWEDFIFPSDASGTLPVLPKLTVSSGTPIDRVDDKSLWARLGLPTLASTQDLGQDFSVNALPFRAYQAIFNEYYRDENLVAEVDLEGNTPQTDVGKLQRRAWEKDYFTSALPFAQKGPAVNLGLDINYRDGSDVIDTATGLPVVGPKEIGADSVGKLAPVDLITPPDTTYTLDNIEDASVTIEELRRGARLQEWLERAARGGTRYKEALLSFFGVSAGDARLDRPEYLGGGRQPITISEVLNTTGIQQDAAQGAPQGDMAGHGIAVGANNNFKYSIKEHGYIMSIMSILPKPSYQQGIPRHFSYNDRYDYYWKEFANIGEQEVLNKELYFQPTATTANDVTFGYQQRYAHYKYACNHTSGDMRSTLDFWHVGRKFTVPPALDETFITPTEEDDLDRIFAVDAKTTGANQFWVQVYNSVKARRPMPYFSNPRL